MMQGQGGGVIWAHHGTLLGPAGKGATVRLLPRTNQDYLGCGPMECGQAGGFLLRHGDKDRYLDTVP